MKSRTELLKFMNSLLFQQFAAANIKDRHHNKDRGCGDENDVQHVFSPIKPLRSSTASETSAPNLANKS
jgi:hypothetical protein